MNTFDIVAIVILAISALAGLATGLVRSIFAVAVALVAMGVAVVYAPTIAPYISSLMPEGWVRTLGVPVLTFLVVALVLGLIVNVVLTLALGTSISFSDRLAGLIIGLVRGAAVILFIVILIDRLVPAGSEPLWLQGSRVRPQASPIGERAVGMLPSRVAWALESLRMTAR